MARFCEVAFGKLMASLPVVSRLWLKISKHSKLWRVSCNSAWRRVGKWKSSVLFKVDGLGSAIFMLLSFQMEDLRYPVWFWFSSMWCGFKWHEGVKHVFAAVVRRPPAVDCEWAAVVTGQLTCLPEFSWDQPGIQLTEATCSGDV